MNWTYSFSWRSVCHKTRKEMTSTNLSNFLELISNILQHYKIYQQPHNRNLRSIRIVQKLHLWIICKPRIRKLFLGFLYSLFFKENYTAPSDCSLGASPYKNLGAFIKPVSKPLSNQFSILFDKIIESCAFPVNWKYIDKKRIQKKQSKLIIQNYRSVASLCKLSLSFERILYQKLYKVIEPQLNETQLGFRKNRSPVSQLLIHHKHLTEAIDRENEFCKAFDRVFFNVLPNKERLFCKGGNLLKLVYSYITGRRQKVLIFWVFYFYQPKTSGVPQGSIIVSLPFLAFLYDIPNEYVTSICLLRQMMTESKNKIL